MEFKVSRIYRVRPCPKQTNKATGADKNTKSKNQDFLPPDSSMPLGLDHGLLRSGRGGRDVWIICPPNIKNQDIRQDKVGQLFPPWPALISEAGAATVENILFHEAVLRFPMLLTTSRF